ncbi:hypothetical protein B0I35DRAFT_409470 [Stachybotrys elegans]|uniref:DSC E3 ubiquitin ligase complex subunit A n=1 Tax=Stachybotrys elegans TaxID=80388 RepID=A0A8K0WQX9_9HYPO|nr:hypothetical protein B0I35DRAFT_409470 [Stachybotrys elegans]
MPQPRTPASVLFFVVFFLWLILPEGDYQSHPLNASDIATQQLARYHDALDVLNTTQWGDFAPRSSSDPKEKRDTEKEQVPHRYLNLTGFREEDGFAWEELQTFRDKSLRLSHHVVPPINGKQLWDMAQGLHVWENASSSLQGLWVRHPAVHRSFEDYNLTQIAPMLEWTGDESEWARNVTGETGRMLISLEGNKTLVAYEQLDDMDPPFSGGVIRAVKATATIEDSEGTGHNWAMKLWGVHWPRQGVMLLSTTSEKFEGIFGLPHLSPGPDYFRSSQRLLNESIANVLSKKEQNIYMDQTAPWSSDIENPLYTNNPSPHCEYIMYAQVHPPTREDLGMSLGGGSPDDTHDAIHAIEEELTSPLGAPIGHIPRLRMSAIMYSPDCGFYIETKGPPDYPPSEGDHLVGVKAEVHLAKIKRWVLVYAAAAFAQVHLLKNQIRDSSTPSNMGRVSFTTMSIMAVADCMTFTGAATWMSSAAATFLPTLALLFASFLSMTIGGSFLARVHEVQGPERRLRDRRSNSPEANTNTANSRAASTPEPTNSGGLLPGPVTAGRPPPPPASEEPIFIPSDQDIDAEIAEGAMAVPRATPSPDQRASAPPVTFQTLVGRCILLTLGLMFLAISSTTWYAGARSFFLNLCAFTYMSLWVPQIYRNIMRNCRRALNWPFVVGQSVLRMLPIAYFWVNPDNFLFSRTDVNTFLLLCGWVWLQILVLVAQDVVGPRFGIPSAWTPEAWDYHPVLREDNIEAGGLPIGLVADDEQQHGGGSDEKRHAAIDCAICKEVLEVPVVRTGEEDLNVAGVFARRLYMVTPCRHIFHSTCLEGWMKFRLQCPICREELPPL